MRPADLTASEAAARIRDGRPTSRALMADCLARIAAEDPAIGAFVRLAPDALGRADAADADPTDRPLRGLPVAIKDIIDTAGLATEYGTPIHLGHVPAHDAACVARLKAAGAIVIGKTVTTELAHATPQATRNPLDPDRTPGGSSSGSAAAVAARMVPVALGTQTGGSVIRPASYCGLYGFKSSCGRTDVAGVHPLGPSLDTVGWLARSAADLALLGSVLLASFRPPQPIDRPRLAVTRTPYDGLATSEARAAPVDLALRLADAEIVELALPAGFTGLNVLHQRLVAIEAARAMADYRDHHADLLTPALRALLASGRRDADAYPALVAEAEAARAALAGLMAGIDALLVPAATGEAPLGLGSTGDAGFSLFWSLLQVPCATLPFARGPANMPIGVQLVGRFGEDERLLSLATWIASRIAP